MFAVKIDFTYPHYANRDHYYHNDMTLWIIKEWIHVILMKVFSTPPLLHFFAFCCGPVFTDKNLCRLVPGCQIKWWRRLYRCGHLFIPHSALPLSPCLGGHSALLIFIDSISIRVNTLSPALSVSLQFHLQTRRQEATQRGLFNARQSAKKHGIQKKRAVVSELSVSVWFSLD